MAWHTLIVMTAIVFVTSSCNQYRGVYKAGKYQSVTHSWKYPALLFPMKIVGTTVLIDTTEGKVLERRRFKNGVGLFGTVLDYARTTTYDTLGRKLKVVTVTANKRVTVEYQ